MPSRIGTQKSSTFKVAIAVVSILVAILSLFVTILVFRASVDYWLEDRNFIKGSNTVTLYCKNGGGMDGDFNLVLTLTNATFSNQTAQPYVQVGNSTVEFRFVLHKGDSNQKAVSFVVNETEQFSLSLSIQGNSFWDFLLLKGNPTYPTYLKYQWNEQQNMFSPVQ
jgi:hypothetical protein